MLEVASSAVGLTRRAALAPALSLPLALALPPARGDVGATVAAVAPPGLARWGRGEFRRFGVRFYEATLWAGDDPSGPPLALGLTYRRAIAGAAIAQASVEEMRHFAPRLASDAQLAEWGRRMAGIFPDVREGDHLLGVYLPQGTSFHRDARLVGRVDDPAFGRAFFAIWLDPQTRAPGLRAQLLTRGAG